MIRTLLVCAATALLGLLPAAGGLSAPPSSNATSAATAAPVGVPAGDELSLAEPGLGPWLTR